MLTTWCSRFILSLLAALLFMPPLAADAAFTRLPAGFIDEPRVSGVHHPTSFAWLPDDTMLITSQDGQVFRWKSSGAATSVLNLSNAVCVGSETGLLGIAVDPQFANGQRFVYLYYTHHRGNGSCNASENRANRLSRFTVSGDLSLGSERVLLDNIAARGGNHNGGDVQFDRQGLLYVTVGDAGQDLVNGDSQNGNGNARRLSLLNGKILRINTDGTAPGSNPFTGSDSAPCAATGSAPQSRADIGAEKKHKNKKAKKRKKRKQRERREARRDLNNASVCREIFATGLRNPYRIAFDPDDTTGAQRFFINDVGGSAWEEINEGVAGADYGWNLREGRCRTGSTSNCPADNRFVDPIFAYTHSGQCSVITGGAFVPDNAGWPVGLRNKYLFADLGCNSIFQIDDQNPGTSLVEFAFGAGASHLDFGPDGALYYADYEAGAVNRIRPTGS